MIIDTFLFNDEFDMLDIHLDITKNYVDKWIVLEASRTFSGLLKPYNLTNNLDRYKKELGDKLEVITLDLTEDQTNLICETMMRRGFRNSLDKCNDDDIIIHGDLDEIINPENWNSIIALMEEHNKPVSCIFEMYLYRFDQKAGRNWKGSVVAKKSMFDTPHDLYKGSMEVAKRKVRAHCVSLNDTVGWHWTWMGNDELIKNKVVSCIESQHRDPEQILQAFKDVDTKSAINHKAGSEIISPKYPQIVFDVLKKYPSYWHNPPGEI
jgi:beta-1,4-mannosyl-glycoprotein beta-1,4-N-acetylglucosaminyltransferase